MSSEIKTEGYRDIEKKFRRGAQIVTRKDAAVIIAETGLQPDWKCLDLGGGSGFLALFLANLVPNGSVTCYEKNERFARIIEENIKKSEMKNIEVKNKPSEEFTEKEMDLITMDMKGAELLIEKCRDALKEKGWLAVYSPHIEQQISVKKSMEEAGLKNIKTLETSQREWKIGPREFSHPVYGKITHTGFVTFGRK